MAEGKVAKMDKNKYSPYYTYIKPIIQHPFTRSFAPYIFSLMTIAIFAIFVIRPTITTILELRQTLETNQKILTILNQKANDLVLAKQNLEAIDPLVKEKIERTLPTHPNPTSLIRAIQNVQANTASLSALQIQPLIILDTNTSSTTLILGEIDFAFSTQGSYNQFLKTIQNLNKAGRIIRIENLTINKQATNSLTLSVTAKGYYLK